MSIVFIIVAVYIIVFVGGAYYAVKHAELMPDDYDMSEAEVKLMNEINNENLRKKQ